MGCYREHFPSTPTRKNIPLPLPAIKLGIFATHPIQYLAPTWRLLAAEPGLELTVYFFSDHSVRGGVDPGFGVNVQWDVPLLAGYAHKFLSRNSDMSRPWSVSLPDAADVIAADGLEAVLVQGYTYRFEHQLTRAARRAGKATILRGELTDRTVSGGRPLLKRLVRDAFLKRFYKRLDAICYQGEVGRRHLERLGTPKNKMHFAPYSIDTNLFEKQRISFPKLQSREALAIPAEATVIMCSGKLVPGKMVLTLVEAIQAMKLRGRVFLLVVGDGEQREQIQSAAEKVLGKRFLLTGFVNQSQIGKYYAAADLLVHPSASETWGLVVNEAMQFGLPAVVSDGVGCAADLVLEGQTGHIFPSGDASALSGTLDRLVSNKRLLETMGRNAIHHIAAYSSAASAAGVREAVLDAARLAAGRAGRQS